MIFFCFWNLKNIYRAFNRFFDIYLTPKRGILHTNFKCREIDGNGNEKLCMVNPDEHFGGHLHGEILYCYFKFLLDLIV